MRQIDIPPIQPKAVSTDRAIYFPRWDCFCCSDTGVVTPLNMAKMAPGYHLTTHPMVACVRKGCYTQAPKCAEDWIGPDDCEELHQTCRQEWLDTVRYWKENREQALAQQASVANGIASLGGGL
jgi:hypothetical protein